MTRLIEGSHMARNSKKARLDYRRLKKMLNPYVKFGFKMPRKGGDFSPQQKAAISRQFNKYGKLLVALKNGEASFIRGKRIPGTLSTRKGSFIQYPHAKTKKPKGEKITLVETRFGKRREIYVPFPKNILDNLGKIQDFVEKWRRKIKPDYIRWATPGQRSSHVYNPNVYTLYQAEFFTTTKIGEKKKDGGKHDFFVGVYMGFDPNAR